MSMIAAFFDNFFCSKPTRLELRLVPYGEVADKLIAEGWTIAPEEDSNRIPLHVYLEKLKSKP